MTASFAISNVRHWTLQEAQEELDRLTRQIEKTGKSVRELRYRASEWELDQSERKLLAAYERFERMVKFARDER